MKSDQKREAHRRFVQALQHEHLTCAKPGCDGPMDVTDLTPHLARIKTYEAECERCQAKEHIIGNEQTTPPWRSRRSFKQDGSPMPKSRSEREHRERE